MKYWIVLIDDDWGQLETVDDTYFDTPELAEAEARRRNETDDELEEGQSWQMREED